MKAVRFHEYGGPEVLRYEDADRPVPVGGPPTSMMPPALASRELRRITALRSWVHKAKYCV